jgi:hypothetical protein
VVAFISFNCDNLGGFGINYKNAEEIFPLPEGSNFEDEEFTDIAEMEDVGADGVMETSTGQASDTVSGFTTPIFYEMERDENNGVVIEWKVKWMAPKASSYAERNKFWIKLLDVSENPVYTIHWKPLPDAADRMRANMYLYDADNNLLNVDTQEQLLFPIPDQPSAPADPKWVSFRFEMDASGTRVMNDLTADPTTTDGNPDWDVIKAVPANIDIDVPDTSGSGFFILRFEYQHKPDYYIQIKDISISYIN